MKKKKNENHTNVNCNWPNPQRQRFRYYRKSDIKVTFKEESGQACEKKIPGIELIIRNKPPPFLKRDSNHVIYAKINLKQALWATIVQVATLQ